MGGIGDRFFAGDATLTRAAVRLADGTALCFQRGNEGFH
jgi:alpha-D-ribose 1-methylphosphonate 5-triphosphate synthase subunit PhnG